METTASKSSLTGGAFIISNTDAGEIFIPEEWTEEQIMIRDTIHDFIRAEIHPRIEEVDSSKGPALMPELLDKAGELGLLSLHIGEQYGGMDMNFNTGLLFTEAAAQGFCFATTIGAQTSIGSLPIVYYGNEDQKSRYLPKIATGEFKCAYCLTEPGAGSDANSGKSKAVLSPDGKNYLLNGQKMWITNGGFADIFIVFAKIDDDENLSAFIVEKAFGGIELGEEEKKMGIKGSSTVQVFFNDCPVPVENLLSERQAGFKIALNILNTGRIKLAAGSIGGGKMATDQSVKYAIERKQFEKSIAEFGAIKHKLGEMATKTFASESAIYRCGNDVDLKLAEFKAGGMEDKEAKLKSVREFAIECAIMKVHGSEVVAYCSDEAVQIFGGMGYSQEAGVERGYRDARITRIYEGTNEINRMLSVGELFKRAYKEKAFDLVKPTKAIPMQTYLPFLNGGPGGAFSEEKNVVEKLKKVFLLIAGTAGQKYKLALVDEQEIIMNLADILAEAYVSESVWLRIEKLSRKKGFDQQKLEIMKKMATVYLYEAVQKVKKVGEDAIISYAEGSKKKMLLGLVRRLTKGMEVNPKNLRREIADYMIGKNGYPF